MIALIPRVISDQRTEQPWRLRNELQRLSRSWMFECQLRSMQSQTSNWIGATSIGLVTNDWMPLLGQMHSNLVLASRFKLYLS